jgi:outer membrane usher protein
VPVPPGSWVRIGEDKREFPVGFDGRVFLAGIAERAQLNVEWHGRRCQARIEVLPTADAVSDLGAVACH